MLYSFLNINVEHPPRKNGLKLVFENTLLRDGGRPLVRPFILFWSAGFEMLSSICNK